MTMNDSNLEEQTRRYRPYDWRPFFRAVAEALCKIGKNAEGRDQKMREKAGEIFGDGHAMLKFPLIDPFSFMYTLARTPHADAPTFERLLLAYVAFEIDTNANPQDITDFAYPHPTRSTLFHSYGSYVQIKGIVAEDKERDALNGVWDLFNAVCGAEKYTDITDEMFRDAIGRPQFGLAKLTQTMFLIKPDVFLPIDDRMLWLPLFPEVADIPRSQHAQVLMYNFIKDRRNTFGGIMKTIIGAFPGCRPYEINLFVWSLATKQLLLNDTTWQISSFAGGANAEDYFFIDGKDGGWNFRENSCVWAGKGRDGDPHLKEPEKGDVIVVRKGNATNAQRVHALAIVWRNNYRDDDQVKAGNDVLFVIYVRVEDISPREDHGITIAASAFTRHHKGVSFYPETEKLLNKIREKQRGVVDIKNNIKQQYGKYIALLDANRNLILTGAPGTGKTHIAKKLASYLLNVDVDEISATPNESVRDRYGFVQFHPSYDYTDFVEGLRPTNTKGAEEGVIGFELKDGTFKAFCERAKYVDGDCVFIIDEINRGEISKIFGELFFSIDPGYRGKKGAVETQYANLHNKEQDGEGAGASESFYVPKNVYIIGTMNDIDRSVESIDFAMRRRFAWKRIGYEETIGMLDDESGLGDDAKNATERLRRLNKAIFSEKQGDGIENQSGIVELSADYHIGAAYMLKLKAYAGDDKRWKNLWDHHLAPLLQEYLRGLPDGTQKLKELKAAYDKTT